MAAKGYNLPDDVSPNDPEAPWNKDERVEEYACTVCGQTFPLDEGEAHECKSIICPTCKNPAPHWSEGEYYCDECGVWIKPAEEE